MKGLKVLPKLRRTDRFFKPNMNFSQSFGNSGSKDTRVIDVLETIDLPENGPIGIKAFSPQKR